MPISNSEVLERAKPYSNRTQFFRNDQYAVKVAKERGIYEQACAHMSKRKRPGRQRVRSDGELLACAAKCSSRSELQRNHSAEYQALRSRGILDTACKHMSSKRSGASRKALSDDHILMVMASEPIGERDRIARERWTWGMICNAAMAADYDLLQFINNSTDAYEALLEFHDTRQSACAELGIIWTMPTIREGGLAETSVTCRKFKSAYALRIAMPGLHKRIKDEGWEADVAGHFTDWRGIEGGAEGVEGLLRVACEAAVPFKTSQEFRDEFPDLYKQCGRQGILPIVTAHMPEMWKAGKKFQAALERRLLEHEIPKHGSFAEFANANLVEWIMPMREKDIFIKEPE